MSRPGASRFRVAAGVLLALLLPAANVAAADGFLEPTKVIHRIDGDPASGFFGWAVSELRDVDGDGVTDFIVGDPTRAGGGAVHVYSGASAELLFTAVRPAPNVYGFAVGDAGDVDGDGTNDVIVGDPLGDAATGAGAAEVLSGTDGSLLHRFVGAAPGESLGTAVAGAGDLDRDGCSDVLVGAGGADTFLGPDTGRVYVFSGACGGYGLIRSVDGLRAGEAFGTGLDRTGDLDADGVGDVVVGARSSPPKDRGRVYAVSAADGSVIWDFDAARSGEEFGRFFVAGLADLDGDGVRDVYAADYADRARGVGTGRAWVLSGADGSPIHGWHGYRNKEGFGPGREAGDVDGDGVQDLAIGQYTSSDGARMAGKLTLFSGETGEILRTVTSTTAGENLGFDAVGLGDVNGDGSPDIIVSAATGRTVYVISGTAD